MSAPCKDCQERYTACHDHCEKYKSWKANEAARKEKERLYQSLGWTYAGRMAKKKSYDRNISPLFEKHYLR